jgi:hypothetical protein
MKKDLAIRELEKAIALHRKHMNGTAPTTGKEGEKSQMEMMQMMQRALSALKGGGFMDDM